MGWCTLGSVGGLVGAAGEVSLVLLCQKQVEERPSLSGPLHLLWSESSETIGPYWVAMMPDGNVVEWEAYIALGHHWPSSSCCPFSLSLVSSGWSHFFMIDPRSLLRKIFSCLDLNEDHLGELVINTDFEPPHQYSKSIWPEMGVDPKL